MDGQWRRLCGFVLAVAFAVAPAMAAEVEWQADNPTAGLRLLKGADGDYTESERGGRPCVFNNPDANPPSQYLYFDVADSTTGDSPVYVIVEYLDVAAGGGIEVEYDSAEGESDAGRYRVSDERWGGFAVGGDAWRTAVYRLDKPRFQGGQNLGADFRLAGFPLYVSAVRLSTERPAGLDELDRTPVNLAPRVRIGAGGQLIIGGFDPTSPDDAVRQTRALERAMPNLKSMGVTSHEGYVRWNLCEPEQGRYDWSVYDGFAALYRKHDIKWVPFLIVGSAYSLPDWYYKKPGSQGYVCLEHGEESDVQSLWNPTLHDHVARFIRAFCEHYGPTGVIESILLGITGNYGEAIYVVTGNDWTADVHGPYHTHPGFWAGDPFARADYRKWLEKKYDDVSALNRAWGTSHAGLEVIEPFLKENAPNDRAWLDMCDWYIGAMTDWARFWMKETRAHFPGDIYLCTGGHAPAEHGADFGEQCKAAAEIGCGVRITNEASDYAANFSLTRWVASAGRQYGAYFSFEPAGAVTPDGVVVRVYNATASGARGLHFYHPNIFGAEAAVRNFEAWGSEFAQRSPVTEIAVYYPETHIKLKGNRFLEKVQPLRDRFDFVYLSDGQVLDGGLERKRALILIDGPTSEASVWEKVQEWVSIGGLLLYGSGMGRLRTVEGDESCHERLFGSAADTGKGRVAIFAGDPLSNAYRDFLAKELSSAPELSAETRRMVAADGADDHAFVTLLDTGSLLWLNASASAIRKGEKELPPWSIATQD